MFKKKLGIVIIIGILGLTVYSVGATTLKLGASSVDTPKGISLRADSRTPRGYGFFLWHSRSHRGGGPAYGK